MNKHNNIHSLPASVAQTTCEWVARLDRGELSLSENQKLREWLAADPLNHSDLAKQLNAWSDMDVLSELTRLELNNNQATWFARASLPRYWFKSSFSVSHALVTLFAICIIGWLGFSGINTPANEVELAIITSIGERKTEALPDGSVVQLNTVSSADISYTNKQRSVTLYSGEAFFDVAHDEDRPFVVYAADTSIRAVGTAFAVFNDNGAIRVAVTQGSVEFISSGNRETISAASHENDSETDTATGNIATYADQRISVETKSNDELSRQLSWQDGMLEFRGESLEQVVQQLSRYTNAQIILDDDIKDVRLGGYFKLGDIEGLASTLALGFNIQVDIISDDLIQISRKK